MIGKHVLLPPNPGNYSTIRLAAGGPLNILTVNLTVACAIGPSPFASATTACGETRFGWRGSSGDPLNRARTDISEG